MRNRDIPIQFYVSPDEMLHIREKMSQMGTTNVSAYMRKMAMDGYVLRIDLPQLDELVSLMRRTGNNINQLAKRANSNGRIYETDIIEVVENQKQLWQGICDILNGLSKM